MIIYYETIAILLLFSFCHKTTIRKLQFKNSSKKITLLHNGKLIFSWGRILEMMIFLFFLAIAGFRSVNVGKDTLQYELVFRYRNNYGLRDSLTGVEPLFTLLNKVIGWFTDNYQVVLFIYAFIILIGPYYLIKKFSNNPYYSYFLYITMGFQAASFSGTRTSMTLSILCFAFIAAKERNLKRFILIVIIACLFHRSAIVFIIVYPMFSWFLTRKKLLMLFFAAAVLYLKGENLFLLITRISIFSKYSIFIKRTGSGTFAFVILMCFFITYLFYSCTKKKYGNIDYFYYMLLFAFIVQLLGAYNTNIMRLTNYFFVFAIVLIPNSFDAISDIRARKIVYIGFSILMVAQFLIAFKAGYGTENYQFFWEQMQG